jgi:two-component system sensor histidine kinase SenX3
MSELLTQFEMDPARRREMCQAINEEAKRLARMTGEYLDIARLESGATPVRMGPVDLATLLDRALLMHTPLAAQKQITLAREGPATPPPLVADADLLARAIGNLLANAIKYSPASTRISLSVRHLAPWIEIRVADQGYGIPAADLDRIFDKFYRIPRVEDSGTPGSGLGLALVREIAGLHGGSITVESAQGQGSTFTLRLPQEGHDGAR